jgi:hypothetical protein
MYKALTHFLVVCLAGLSIALVDRLSADAYDVYYLSVGNSKYQDDRLDIPDANLSARGIAQYLR